MKNRFFTKTFTKFFFAFVLIIGGAFGVLVVASTLVPPTAVDSVASPK